MSKARITIRTVLIMLAALPYSVGAAEYFVATNGNDISGSGASSSPWRSLAWACRKVTAPGSVIRLLPGTYRESGACVLSVGVSVIGQGRGVVTVSSAINDAIIRGISPTLVRGDNEIAGFTIDGKNRALDFGVYFRRRTHITVRDMSIQNVDTTALQISGGDADFFTPPNEWVTDVAIYRNRFKSCSRDFATWTSGCIQVSALQGGTIADNEIDEDRGGGIKKVGYGWFRGTKVLRNTVRVPNTDALWGADISIELWNVRDDVQVAENNVNSWMSFEGGARGAGRNSVKVLRNIVQVNDFGNVKEGMEVAGVSDGLFQQNQILNTTFGIALWGRTPADNTVIRGNVFAGRQDGEGVRVHYGTGITICNNSFIGLAKGVGLVKEVGRAVGNATVVNNLFLYTQHGVVTIGASGPVQGVVVNKNLQWGGTAISEDWGQIPSAASTSGNLIKDPKVVVEAGYKVRPVASDSPLIDAGQATGFRFCGRAPDIGSYENCPAGTSGG